MRESEEDFAVDHPDYLDAATHYRTQREEELKDAGYTGAFLQRKLADDLFGVVRMALESGQDPAERVYALAQKRGFKVGQKAADGKLGKLAAASDAARSAGGGNRANGAVLSWGDVAKLDGAARDKAWAKLRERERGRAH
jgi:alkylated DNA nucleotide flippase Atl1